MRLSKVTHYLKVVQTTFDFIKSDRKMKGAKYSSQKMLNWGTWKGPVCGRCQPKPQLLCKVGKFKQMSTSSGALALSQSNAITD